MSKTVAQRAFFVALATLATTSPLYAAEGGAGFYLPGSKGPAAAVMPPAGTYFQNDLFFYSGSLGGSTELPTGGRLALGVDGRAALTLPTVLWVVPQSVMGGSLGLSFTLPIGWKETKTDLTLAGPQGGTAASDVTDDIFTVGDPVASAMLGWSSGNLHWQVGTIVNIPIGDYKDGALSNVAFHHWGADLFTAMTWLDPASGIDVSGAAGVTFNAENPATDYRTGNEFHLEGALSKNFSAATSAGIVGYYYQQLTGDSGDGASGPFKGRVTALGVTFSHTFVVNERPVAARVKYFHEFDADNRAEGDALILSLSLPL